MKKSLIICGKLFDGIHDELFEHREILVEGGRIAAVGENLWRDENTEIIDLSHLTVTPGLIDAYMQAFDYDYRDFGRPASIDKETLATLNAAKKSLERGFTSVRMSGGPEGCNDVRRAIDQGYFPGSRLQAAIATCTTGSSGDRSTIRYSLNPYMGEAMKKPGTGDGTDFFRYEVRRQIKYGYDFIKLVASGGFFAQNSEPAEQQMDDDELSVAISNARERGCNVTARAYENSLIRKLVDMGAEVIEQAGFINEETAEYLVRKGTYVVPTFNLFEKEGKPDFMLEKLERYDEVLRHSRKIIMKSGIKLCYGSAVLAGHNCYDSWREYRAWLEMGGEPYRMLKGATSVNAEMMGWGDCLGSIEPGKLADIAAWHRDILNDPMALSECDFVMKEGMVFPSVYSVD